MEIGRASRIEMDFYKSGLLKDHALDTVDVPRFRCADLLRTTSGTACVVICLIRIVCTVYRIA